MKTALLTCGLLALASDLAFALSCQRPNPESIAKGYKTVFVAFVTEGHFIESGEAEECGWIEGYFEVVEELKGNSNSVSVIRKRLVNCNNTRIAGASDSFPIGKYILVKTNSEVGNFGLCDFAWADYLSNCYFDAVRRQLNIDAPDIEMRESCIKIENFRGELSREEALRARIDYLEGKRATIDTDLEEIRNLLESSGSPEEEY